MTAYVVDPDGGVTSRSVDSSPVSNERPPTNYSFLLAIGPGQAKTVYLRFAVEGLFNLRATLWDSFEYLKADEIEAAIAGIIIGVMVAVFIYTFFIAISLRQRAYTFYLIYLFGIFLYVIAFSGAGASFFWAKSPWVGKRALPFSQAVMAFGICLFARNFLGPRRRCPALSFALSLAAVASSAQVLCLAVLDLRFAMYLGSFADSAARLVVLAAAIHAAAEGGRQVGLISCSHPFTLAFAQSLELNSYYTIACFVAFC